MHEVIKKLKRVKDVRIVILDIENLLDNQTVKYFVSQGLQIRKINHFNEERIEEILKQADIVLLSSFDNEKLDLKINELCVENKIPLLTARMFSRSCEIGPLVIPYKSACLKCYQLRLESNNSKNTKGSRKCIEFLPLLKIFTSYIFLELVNFLVFKNPLCLGNVLEIDFKNFSIKRRPVLKVPFCPVCGDTYGKRIIR